MSRLAWGLLVGVLCACSRSLPTPPSSPDAGGSSRYVPADGVPGCILYSEPQHTGAVPPELPELSGLAASALHPGVFWAHNDSDNGFRLYAIDEGGKVLATLTLTGASPLDLEDVAVGPCAPGQRAASCVYLADIGDNLRDRQQVRLFRLPEPTQLADATLPVEPLAFVYPDGHHDAEALIMNASTGQLAVITKTPESLGDVYVLENLRPGETGRASRLGTLQAPSGVDRMTTGASLHPSGERLLLRTYTRVWEVRRPKAPDLAALMGGQVVEVPGASQAQAEAIAFLADGDGYLLGSEFTGQPMYRTRCR
ncbi:conserved uncharacterized protein [Stigmatella aurantiaca DW4/3-1]|uniref:Conserved uncharacterized protein n=1 Tax=Stigmatella aurantiaca (strain DW4/3-1) TaxID=378806 RepID=E3G0A1_STIAD|nr:hypothetical protein [Stigmatella aurantiaca]ADO72494.1 conserved uncharacterized protein [Stigmatella aurantiaca DW4/3-1]